MKRLRPHRRALALLLLGVGFAFDASTALGEYNFPVKEPAPPPDGVAERTFLSLPAGGSADAGSAAVTGDFTEFRPTPKRSPEQLAATLQEAERLRAMNSLERAKALDDELVRVRQMLSEKNREEAQANAAPAVPAPVAMPEPHPQAPVGVPSVETASTSRLLAAVQDDDGRRSERARLELLRESLVRKQRGDPSYTRAAGGSKFHAAIEFNSALRGSSAPGAQFQGRGAQDRLAEAPERPSNRQVFPIETSESQLLMHKFRAVDLSIPEGKQAQQPPEERKYQLKGSEPFDSNIKDPMPSLGGGQSGSGGSPNMIRPF